LIFFVKEIPIRNLLSSSISTTIFGNIARILKNNKPFVILLVITGIFSLGAFNFSFILLMASDLGIQQSTIPIVYAAINITHTIIGIPAGLLADKFGKEKILILGYSIFALSSILMTLFSNNNYVYVYSLALVFGLYVGISETVQRAIIPKYVSADLRGTAYGLYNIVTGICLFVSNLTFGYIWDTFSVTMAVIYSLFFSLCTIGGMVIFVKKYSYPSTDIINNPI
jgi:MFS family permease